MTREFCRDCICLVEGDNGEWVCDECQKTVEEVAECPESEKQVKQIIVADIKWDAPKSAKLPKKIVIDINESNEYLLEDIDGYADNLCNYLSDEYEYCIEGFNAEVN